MLLVWTSYSMELEIGSCATTTRRQDSIPGTALTALLISNYDDDQRDQIARTKNMRAGTSYGRKAWSPIMALMMAMSSRTGNRRTAAASASASAAPSVQRPPSHVVGPDGGTVVNGDVGAQNTRRDIASLNTFNEAANTFFGAPVGPAFPPGYSPQFVVGARPPNVVLPSLAVANVVQPRLPPPPRAPAANTHAAPAHSRGSNTTVAASGTATGTSTSTSRTGVTTGTSTGITTGTSTGTTAATSTSAAPGRALLTREEMQLRADAAMRRNMDDREKKAAAAYRSNYKSYCKFAAKEGIAREPPFITPEGVELYFSEVISKQTVLPTTAQRRLTSLKFYAKVEQPGKDIVLDTPIVLSALETQRGAYANHQLRKDSCPHEKLPTATLKLSDYYRIMDHAVLRTKCSNWIDFGFTMAGGNCSFMRMDSMRKLVLSTLACDDCHGPERQGRASNMVGFILLAGTQKTAGQGTRVAGAWPHRDVRRCTTFFLAASLFMRLRYPPSGMSFIRDEKGKYPWRDISVLSWRDASSAETAYNQVLRSLNIEWKHVVHMRSAGIEEASTWAGLQPDEISTMSKHWSKADRLRESYISELTRSTCCALSGFGNDVRGDGITDWYVPECYLDVAKEWPDFANIIFPHRQAWIDDTQEPCGDKDTCAQNFLHHLLPHLAERLIQRGIYFMKYAPEHPLTKALDEAMGPRYRQWAAAMRRECDSKMAIHEAKMGLKNDIGGTLYDFSSRLGTLEQHLANDKKEKEKDREERRVTNRLLRRLISMQEQRDDSGKAALNKHTLGDSQSSGDEDDDSNPGGSDGGSCTNGSGNFDNQGCTDGSNGINGAGIGDISSKPAARVVPSLVLRDRAVEPMIPEQFPSSVVMLLNQHNQGNWNKLKMVDKRHWEGKVRTRYSRRQNFFQMIEGRAQRLQSPPTAAGKMVRAATIMEEERNRLGLSMSDYFRHLRKDMIGFRNRKRPADELGI